MHRYDIKLLFAFTFASHKIMRWLCPFFLIGAVISCSLLAGTFYRLALTHLSGALVIMS